MSELRFDLSGLTRWVSRLVVALILAELFLAHTRYLLIRLANAIESGQLSQAEIAAKGAAVENWVKFVGYSYIGVFVIACFFGGIWIYRASWNARELQPVETRITPGWALGWNFVPVMCLWKPYVAMRQTWNSSDNPGGDVDGATPPEFRWWWGSWVISNLLGNISGRLWESATELASIRKLAVFDLFTSPVTIAACVCFILVIRRVDAAQAGKQAGAGQ